MTNVEEEKENENEKILKIQFFKRIKKKA